VCGMPVVTRKGGRNTDGLPRSRGREKADNNTFEAIETGDSR
jgi:hypothetical protein